MTDYDGQEMEYWINKGFKEGRAESRKAELEFLKSMVKHNWTDEQMRYEIRKRINEIDVILIREEIKNGKKT